MIVFLVDGLWKTPHTLRVYLDRASAEKEARAHRPIRKVFECTLNKGKSFFPLRKKKKQITIRPGLRVSPNSEKAQENLRRLEATYGKAHWLTLRFCREIDENR